MASPVQMFTTLPNDSLFATPNFDDFRDGNSNEDFSYFDSLNAGGDSMLLPDNDFSQPWPSVSQTQQQQDQLLDPLLTSNSTFSKADLPFGSTDTMFPAPELSPPTSATDDLDGEELFAKQSYRTKLPPKLPTLDTQIQLDGGNHTQRYGQITPPMSSKSPELESVAEPTTTTTTKRGRKPSAKAKKNQQRQQDAAPVKQPKAPRKSRKTAKAQAEQPEDEEQSEESKAKRARFLERNRQAAYTCRQRKKLWAKDLEDKHRGLERDNQNLKLVLASLKDEYHYLRQQVVSHSTCDCTGAREYIQRASKALENGEHSSPLDAASPKQGGSPPIEQTLRASLADFDADGSSIDPSITGDTKMELDLEPEGPELDGMTL